MKYQVIVGNIGTVLDTDSPSAYFQFNSWVGESKRNTGRASGEPVTLMCDGEPIKEYAGTPADLDEAEL